MDKNTTKEIEAGDTTASFNEHSSQSMMTTPTKDIMRTPPKPVLKSVEKGIRINFKSTPESPKLRSKVAKSLKY